MKAIHADPREIRKLFAEEYIIPDFQRPYSWTEDECDRMWDDFVAFHDNRTDDDQYFLGNIVIHHNEGKKSYSVIDGQQRLTTLLLLIKALHLKAGTATTLEECLKMKDPLTSELTGKLRVTSKVMDDDFQALYDIVFNGANLFPESRLTKNFYYLVSKLDNWWLEKSHNATALNELILTLLDHIVLLPIHCDSQDDALTIFETINNRGMLLTDADIFKAKIYTKIADKEAFITNWTALDNHDWLFRLYMHIVRSKKGDTSKEVGLRSYFKGGNLLQIEPELVMETINKISSVYDWNGNSDVQIFWAILDVFPNQYWNYPIFVYLEKNGHIGEDTEFSLDESKITEFVSLLEIITRLFYIKGLVYNSVNSVRDIVFRICKLIQSNGNYKSYIEGEISGDLSECSRKLNLHNYGRYTRGLVLLSAYLNQNQDKSKLAMIYNSGAYHIEHILPKKWNDYDGWSDEKWTQKLNILGNLVPLEWRLNICAKNEYFDRKKQHYLKSQIKDVSKLLDFDTWYPADVDQRHKDLQSRIEKFFVSNSR